MTAPRPAPTPAALPEPAAAAADELLTRAEQARLLKVSTRTIMRLEERGALPPPLRIGRRVGQWRSVILRAVSGP